MLDAHNVRFTHKIFSLMKIFIFFFLFVTRVSAANDFFLFSIYTGLRHTTAMPGLKENECNAPFDSLMHTHTGTDF